jgi:hypothetical protein
MHRGHWDGVFLGEYTHCMAWRVMDMDEQDEAILKCLNLALVLSLPLPCLAVQSFPSRSVPFQSFHSSHCLDTCLKAGHSKILMPSPRSQQAFRKQRSQNRKDSLIRL